MPNLPYESQDPECNAEPHPLCVLHACKPNQANANEHNRQYRMQTPCCATDRIYSQCKEKLPGESRKRRHVVIQEREVD
jgi:hypothetical protein